MPILLSFAKHTVVLKVCMSYIHRNNYGTISQIWIKLTRCPRRLPHYPPFPPFSVATQQLAWSSSQCTSPLTRSTSPLFPVAPLPLCPLPLQRLCSFHPPPVSPPPPMPSAPPAPPINSSPRALTVLQGECDCHDQDQVATAHNAHFIGCIPCDA